MVEGVDGGMAGDAVDMMTDGWETKFQRSPKKHKLPICNEKKKINFLFFSNTQGNILNKYKVSLWEKPRYAR